MKSSEACTVIIAYVSQTDVPRGMYCREFLVSLKTCYLYTRSSGDTVAKIHSSDTTAKEAEGEEASVQAG